MTDVYSNDWLVPRYGMHAVDYADVWPDLTAALRKLYLDKTAGIPWLPADWRASIGTLHGSEGKLLLPVRSFAVSSTGQTPTFLNTAEKRAWWDQFHAQVQDMHQKFVDGKRQEGLALAQAAYDRSAFWTKAYNIATVLATPVTMVQGTVGVMAAYPKLVQGALIGGAALLAWYFFRRKD